MIRIDIGERNFLLYLVLLHPLKMRLLSAASLARLDRINRAGNEVTFSGAAASGYDAAHRYGEGAQQEYPVRMLIRDVWGRDGFGDALDLGAGSGYFTLEIARRARSVVAVEPVDNMRAVLVGRCAEPGVANIRPLGVGVHDLSAHVAEASIDSAFVRQSLHHVHRRVEPHYNLRRAARLFKDYLRWYRRPEFWRAEANWTTHDFLTRRELRSLCRAGGLTDVRISTYWFPYARRVLPNPARRLAVERALGRVPVVRHIAAVLGMEATRTGQRLP